MPSAPPPVRWQIVASGSDQRLGPGIFPGATEHFEGMALAEHVACQPLPLLSQ